MMQEEKIWLLAGKKLTGEASEDELLDFEKMLQNNPDWEMTWQILNTLCTLYEYQDKEALDLLFKNQLEKITQANRHIVQLYITKKATLEYLFFN